VVNQNAKVGANCRIIGSVVIGATDTDKVPVLGDNIFIGFGAAVIGNITIANGVAIGANAVVSKSIETPNVSVAGIPAAIISDKGSANYLVEATKIAVCC